MGRRARRARPHGRFARLPLSTPAILWTADRPQEKGIHVHVNDGAKRVVDDTFSEVTLNGALLDRRALLDAMIQKTVT